MQSRMASNNSEYNKSFQAAESSLRAAETWIEGQLVKPADSASGATGVWFLNAPDPIAATNDMWWEEAAGVDTWWATGTNAIAHIMQ